jgi:hypothetical protein
MLKHLSQLSVAAFLLFYPVLSYAQTSMDRETARGTDWGGVMCATPIFLLFIFLLVKYGAPPAAFLCDGCQYNDSRYCNQPERPNATSCDEYKRK